MDKAEALLSPSNARGEGFLGIEDCFFHAAG
jgi:hypothetical protein